MKIAGWDFHDPAEGFAQTTRFSTSVQALYSADAFYRVPAMTASRRRPKKLTAEALIRAIASSTAIETGQSVESIERKLKLKDSKFLHLSLAK